MVLVILNFVVFLFAFLCCYLINRVAAYGGWILSFIWCFAFIVSYFQDFGEGNYLAGVIIMTVIITPIGFLTGIYFGTRPARIRREEMENIQNNKKITL